MPAELTAHDVEVPSEPLDEILASPGTRVVDEHGHEVALSPKVAGFLRSAVTAARGSGKVFLFTVDDTMSPAQAAELLGVWRPMVYRYIEDGLLEDRPVNTYHRIPAASVQRLADERRAAASNAARLLRDDPDHPRVARGTGTGPCAAVPLARREHGRPRRRRRPVGAALHPVGARDPVAGFRRASVLARRAPSEGTSTGPTTGCGVDDDLDAADTAGAPAPA